MLRFNVTHLHGPRTEKIDPAAEACISVCATAEHSFGTADLGTGGSAPARHGAAESNILR